MLQLDFCTPVCASDFVAHDVARNMRCWLGKVYLDEDFMLGL
jgi:hypothetical protein